MFRALFEFIYFYIVFFSLHSCQQETNFTVRDDKEHSNLDWNVWCKYQPNAYDCNGSGARDRFYYDIKMQDCKTARFGSCRHNANQFNSLTDCHSFCTEPGKHQIRNNLSQSVYCRLQHDFGRCDGYHPMWYFDVTVRTCKGFSYSGCGGNHNRFPTAQLCAAVCGSAIDYRG